jgi:hypothetical protein
MNKKFSPDAVRRTSEMLRAGGIKQLSFLMLGGPGETKESAKQSLAFSDFCLTHGRSEIDDAAPCDNLKYYWLFF